MKVGTLGTSFRWLSKVLVIGLAVLPASIPVRSNSVRQRQRSSQTRADKKAQPDVQAGDRGLSVRNTDVKKLPDQAKRWALIIGIDHYDDDDINPLEGAVRDAKALKQALIKYSGFDERNVFLLTSDSRERDLKPTRDNIIDKLSILDGEVPTDGLLLFAFSGHGVELEGQAFLLPMEARLRRNSLYLSDKAISVERIKEYINKTNVRQRIMFLDACRNKLSTGKGSGGSQLGEKYEQAFDFDFELKNRKVDAFLTFYATEKGQESWENSESGQGYFTEAIVEALKGGPNGETLNEQGEVTLGALTKYVQETVADRTKRVGKPQVPHPVTDGYGNELIIAKVEGRRAPNLAATGETVAMPDKSQTESVYWYGIQKETNPEYFKEYLDDYPKGQFAKLALIKIRELEQPWWSSIANSDGPQPFNTYLQIYPNGRFVTQAKKKIAELGSVQHDGSQAGQTTPASQQQGLPTGQNPVPIAGKPDPEADLWKTVSGSSNPELLQFYLNKYPKGRYAAEALALLDSVAEIAFWNSIQGRSEPEAFEDYLRRYPRGTHAEGAKARAEELKEVAYWDSIAVSTDPESFKEYLKRFPKGMHHAQASARFEELSEIAYWNSISTGSNQRALEDYLRRYPSGKYTAQAQARLGELAEAADWARISNSSDPSAFDQYLKRYPNSQFAQQAKSRRDELAETALWRSVADSNDPRPIRDYLQKYPSGRFVAQANTRLGEIEEAALWNTAAKSQDIGALNEYLRKYPNGKFASQASAKLAELTETSYWNSIANSPNPEAFNEYLRRYPNGRFAQQAKTRFEEKRALLNEQGELELWKSVADSARPEEIDKYLKQYPNGKFAGQAKAKYDRLTEAAYWNAIAGSTNPDALSEYLKRYPDGQFTKQARSKLDELQETALWNSVSNAAGQSASKGDWNSSANRLGEYLTRYPDGRFAQLAKTRLEEARARVADQTELEYWSSISNSNDTRALNEYLSRYPNGKFVQPAKAKIDAQAEVTYWNSISGSKDAEALKEYLRRYPNGQFAQLAKASVDQLTELNYWNSISYSTDPEAFTEYLTRYPSGEHAKAATARYVERKETALWNSIVSTTKPADFQEYLRQYPNGRFASDAKARLADLATKQPSPSPSPSGPTSIAAQPAGAKQPADEAAAATVRPSPRLASGLDVQQFHFKLVKLNAKGAEPQESQGQANYFDENVGGVTLRMVEIPEGTFMMGSSEALRERPQHRVSVKAVFMGEFEVTQALWRAVAKLPKVNIELVEAPSYFKGPELPVGNVNWDEAVEFCARLSKITGRTYRLPSEAEWEYACRAGTTTAFSFGDNISTQFANFDGSHPYKGGSVGEVRHNPVAVGSLGVANAFGLYDMHGNAMEWCLDVWHDSYDQAPTDGAAWNNGGDSTKRVLRGGDWTTPGGPSRSSARLGGARETRSFSWGFRVVMDPH